MPHPLDDFWPSLFARVFPDALPPAWLPLQERFFLRTGKPAATDNSHESRMQAFQEWVFLDRQAPRSLLARHASGLDETGRATAQALLSAQTGVFVLMATWKQTAWLRDLLGGADFLVHEQPPVSGLSPGQAIQTRLFWHKDALWMTLGRVVHPENATESIASLISRLRARRFSTVDILHTLMKLEWRARLHPRMNPAVFYDEANPLVQDLLDSPVPDLDLWI